MRPAVISSDWNGAQPLPGQEAATQRAIGEKPYAGGLAQGAEISGGAAVNKRKGYLIGGDRNSISQSQCEMCRIEIGHTDGLDQALIAQCFHLVQGIKPGRMLERPPMELQQID